MAAPRTPDCTILLDGTEVPAVLGEPVAVSLHAAGHGVLSRSIKYHRPHSFFCLAGHCGACLMRISGVPNLKACRVPVEAGLAVERQNAFPSGSYDLLAAADFLFPRGMDHHTMFTSPRPVNALMQKVVRKLGGLGKLPADAPSLETLPRARRRTLDVAVVGAGPAGLAAATAIARSRPGSRVTVFDEGDRPGGSLLSHPAHGPASADAAARDARNAGVEVVGRASAVAWYPEDEGGLLAVDEAGTLCRVRARRYVYATGAYDVNALFPDNDRPGIFAARAVGALWLRYGVRAGARPLVLGDGPYARALADALTEAGGKVSRVDGIRERIAEVRGHSWVRGVVVSGAGPPRKLACDAIAVAALPAPASELPRQHGVAVALRAAGGGFGCVVDERGRTAVPAVFACGDVCGFVGIESAREQGAIVGAAIAQSLDGSP